MTSDPPGWKGHRTSSPTMPPTMPPTTPPTTPPATPPTPSDARTSHSLVGEFVSMLTTHRITLLLIAGALVAGLTLGNLIGSPAPTPVLGDVSAAPTELLRAEAVVDLADPSESETSASFPTASDAIHASESEIIPSADSAVYQDSEMDEVEFAAHSASEVAAPKAQVASVARYAAIPIDSLPLHQPERIENASGSLTIVTRGEIAAGESLGSSLARQGISPATVHLIATEMRKVFDFRRSRPGDWYRLGQEADGRVLDFRYSQNAEESYYLAWEGTRYTVRKETAELHAQVARIAGVVDSSFYGAIIALGEQSALAAEFVRIFAWDIDFSRNVYPGDEFSILYERLYRRNLDGEEVYVRPGRILAGRYSGKMGPHTVVYFEDEKQGGAYFRPDGTSLERAFLAAPLEFSRISSRFTRARHHPILKVTRPHPGIDYAAPHGTPVYAVAEGVVEYKARAGASGNLVRIRHAGGYTSHYAHLSRFHKTLEIGDRVQQKQVIGYVGSSGLSTGPHVCFRVKKDGRYVDPMKISSPAGNPVERERLADFLNVRDQLLANLGPAPLNLADEAL
jgi:murein DD-endopeptidase MepM/ murein hydrolase activator NlpD